jgi:hypothetical protein
MFAQVSARTWSTTSAEYHGLWLLDRQPQAYERPGRGRRETRRLLYTTALTAKWA